MPEAPAPFRIAFDNARDPYTARNALGINLSDYGNVSNVGTPVSGQFAQWTGATTIQGITAAAAGAVIAPAWTAYTPTVTAGSGSFTSASATGAYLTIGKVTHIRIDVTITTNGTAAVYVGASLPNTAVGLLILSGREIALTGKMLAGTISGSVVTTTNYDNTYPGANGSRIVVSGIYENT